MAKKDAKAKKAEKKARVEKKTEKKEKQKEKKAKNRPKGDDSDTEDVDLDAIMAEYAKQQEQFLKVTETACEPPTARGSSTLIASPANDNELFLFGGEYYNGALAHFFNDLHIYNVNRDEWRQVTSPNSPLPRSGHAWCRGGNAGGIYLFGGEFSSPKQGTFYHYNDFWRFEPSTREWSRLEYKGKGPPARSGHRMTYFKKYIILYGGFQDTSQQTKYLQDLWIYDCESFTWHEPKLPPTSQKPDARSSFSFLPHESGAVLYGGYSRIKDTKAAGRAAKGGGPASRVVYKPMVHQDTWLLRIVPPASDAPTNTLPKVHWERRKKPANPPNPVRAGVTMAHHKGRGILFGGVHDVEESEEGIDSEFFNQLFVWNIDRNRFFPLSLRKPRAQPKKDVQIDRGRGGRTRANEAELLANLARLEMQGNTSGEAASDIADLTKIDEDDVEKKPEKPTLWEMPHPRFNAQLAVQDDVLYIFGGTFEKGDREYTFNEMWSIDLGKLDGAKEIFRRELGDWEESESEDEEEEEEDEDEDEEMEDEEPSEPSERPDTSATSTTTEPMIIDQDDGNYVPDLNQDQEQEPAKPKDNTPHPRPFESLREFYARTSNEWQDVVIDKLNRTYGGDARTVKEIKTLAFERAEEKWWDSREEITALEDEQIEAGIGEVVSLQDKNAAGGASTGGPGRRR